MAALHYLVASVNVRSALLCLIVFLILTFIVHRHRRRIKNLPPGPRSWPVFGCLPELVQVKLPFHELFCSLAQKYGPVCYLSAPFGQAVVISGYDAVHESLTREEFNWKSPGYKEQLSNKMFSAKGILLASGDPWKEHRKFSLTVLRGFGVGKRSFEDQIASESEFLMHEIKASNGKAFDPSSFFYNAVSNVICSVVFGRRFEYNDLEFTTLLHLLEDAVPHLPTELFLFIAPFLSKIPFFPKGTETTSITLRWSLLYMLKYPYVQKRVQEEIDSVVGRDRLPKLSDKPNLPYTEAVIHEIQRFASIAAITGLRYNRSEVEFRGYTIPKGTHVISNLYSVTRDPSVWVEPDSFQPERFLDDDKQFKKNPKQMVFGAGKRVCLGKQLAVMELFIFYTHLMHRFSFHKPDGMESVDIHPKARGVLTPYPYNICAVVRECM
ncbi:cytochrome P450 2J6-like isoform X2 [Amphiura filiformis]|uniref:cytochrome P450 2J6-like isoform X2 n=1 Tax=Amphiura filiformis TaxID=82378 RepID=UPI003B20F6A5